MLVRSVDEGLSYLDVNFSVEREEDGDIKISLEYKRLEYRRRSLEVYSPSYSPRGWKDLKAWTKRILDWVEDILRKQKEGIEKIEEKAKELLESIFSPESVAKRILEFAYSLSKGDVSKIPILREAVERAFEEVEKMFDGNLPDVSKKTKELVMKGFDSWEKEGYLSSFEELEYVEGSLEIELVA